MSLPRRPPLVPLLLLTVTSSCAPVPSGAATPATAGTAATAATRATPANPARDSAAAASAVAAAAEAWLQAYERGDAEALAAMFTADGMYAANTGQLLRGRAGIRDGVRGWAAAQRGILTSLAVAEVTGLDVSADVLRLRAAGDAASVLSRFLIRVEPSGCVLDAGHALAVWTREADGEWRIESLAVNQDREPPPGACARR